MKQLNLAKATIANLNRQYTPGYDDETRRTDCGSYCVCQEGDLTDTYGDR